MNIDLLSQDLYIKDFIEKNNLNNDYLNNHLSLVNRVLASRKKCEGCLGLENCKQNSKGERLSLSYKGVIFEEIELCEYALKNLKKNNLANEYLYCDIANQYLDIDLNNINYTEDQRVLYAFMLSILHNKSSKGLYICGDLGVGKTYLSIALANSLVKNGKKVAFVKVADFFNVMKSYFGSDSKMIDITINKLKNAEYLFFDDIGAESVSEFIRDDILLRILDYRLENKLVTVFTSNLNKEELLKHYQYDRKEKSNLMKSKRLVERIDILTDDYVLSGKNLRR